MSKTEAGKAAEPSQDDYALVAKAAAEIEAPELPYRPPMPRDREQPIALVGAGGISAAHLEAYARYGLNVVAICSRDLERARARRDAHFPNARVTDDFDTLLRDPNIRVLDLTAHPDVRLGPHAARPQRRQARAVAETVRGEPRRRARTR